MRIRAAVALLAGLALLGPVAPAWAEPSAIESKRREAQEVRERIERQAERLSIADEDFNEVRVELAQVEDDLVRARSDVAVAERRWTELRDQLGDRARMMYKHRGLAIEAYLGSRSIRDLDRTRVLARAVLIADAELVEETELARRAAVDEMRELRALRARAEDTQRQAEDRRLAVRRELSEQRRLLDEVDDELRDLIEAERQAEIAAAERAALAAPEPAPVAAPAPEALPAPPSPPPDEPDPEAEPEPEPDPEPAPEAAPSNKAAVAVAAAASQIGKPYRWAGSGPESFDCSGLTSYAWAKAGVYLPHSSRAQFASLPKVARSDLRPGDLVFFGTPIHHVGIYEGNGIMIHAPTTGRTVHRYELARRSDYVGAARPGVS